MRTPSLAERESMVRLAIRRQVLRAREDPVEFIRFAGRREGDKPIRLGQAHVLWQRLLTEHDRFVLFSPVGSGKPLACSTEIPTPTGWTTMGELSVGDLVLGGDGKPVRVTRCSPAYLDQQTYRLTTRDGAIIRATGDHVWAAWTTDDPRRPQLVQTSEIRRSLDRGWTTPPAGPASYPHEQAGQLGPREIVSVEPDGHESVRCITVDSDEHTFLATRDYIVTHNSSQITRWRVEWELGRNPDLRIGIVSVAKSGVPQKFLSAIRGDIEENPRLRLTFPTLRPSKGAQRMWGASGLIVARNYSQPDPSIQTFGLYGKILGSRLDLIILDDVCNMENTLTPQSRTKMWDWLSGEVFSRLPPEGGGRIWALGHIWDQDDVLERMRKLEGYAYRKFSAWVRHPDTQLEIPLIPELWTPEDLARRERELGPIMGSLMLRNRLPDRSAGRIRLEWFAGCVERGDGLRMSPSWNPSHSPTYTGVDLGTGVGGDLTCMVTATVLPDGSRQVLDVRSGDWGGPAIIDQLVDIHKRYGSQIMVESNAAQRFLTQFAGQLTALPLREHTTGMNKRDQHFGVESLGLEIYNGKWIIPSVDGVPARSDREPPDQPAEVAQMIRELCAYSPDPRVHTGDRAMAWWICRECIRQSSAAEGYTDHPDLDAWSEHLDTQVR